jgi:predicted nucleic acid-binding protein
VAPPLTIDASVFVSALSSAEARSDESVRFLEMLRDHPRLVILPTLVRPEIAGALTRRTGDPGVAREAAGLAFLGGQVLFVDLDSRLADEAAELAIAGGLRGADAVYAATARRFDAVLVTLDGEQRAKLAGTITVTTPCEVSSI